MQKLKNTKTQQTQTWFYMFVVCLCFVVFVCICFGDFPHWIEHAFGELVVDRSCGNICHPYLFPPLPPSTSRATNLSHLCGVREGGGERLRNKLVGKHAVHKKKQPWTTGRGTYRTWYHEVVGGLSMCHGVNTTRSACVEQCTRQARRVKRSKTQTWGTWFVHPTGKTIRGCLATVSASPAPRRQSAHFSLTSWCRETLRYHIYIHL